LSKEDYFLKLVIDGNSNKLRQLLTVANNDSRKNLLNHKFEEHGGKTLLHIAAEKDHIDIVRILIENGADIKATDKDMHTAIHSAAKKGCINVISILCESQANIIFSKDKFGNTLMHYAALGGQLETIEYLETLGLKLDDKNKHDRTLLHIAAITGQSNLIIPLAVKHKLPVEGKDDTGSNPLHLAVAKEKVEVVKHLIYLFGDAGEDINATNDRGETALDVANVMGNKEIIDTLKYYGGKEGVKKRSYTEMAAAEKSNASYNR
jgi:ankyrin repeat protein